MISYHVVESTALGREAWWGAKTNERKVLSISRVNVDARARNNTKDRKIRAGWMALIVALAILAFPGAALAAKLELGDSGKEVEALQRELQKQGEYGNEEITGFYGAVTKNAVIRFQEKKGLEADGVAGEQTLKKLFGSSYEKIFGKATGESQAPSSIKETIRTSSDKNEKDAKDSKSEKETSSSKSTESKYLRRNSEGSEVREIQERLNELGYLKDSEVTGHFGSATEKSVQQFQKAHSLEEDGVVGEETRKVMFSSRAVSYQEVVKQTSRAAAEKEAQAAKSSSTAVKTVNLSSNSDSDAVSRIIAYAKTLLGKPYVYGAMGPDSFDCSGFTAYVFGKFDVKISHSSKSQATLGSQISSISDLQAGDLVFFDTLANSGSNIDHVGLYMGGGNFIHAGSSSSTGRQVKISPLDSGFYNQTFQWGCRILK